MSPEFATIQRYSRITQVFQKSARIRFRISHLKDATIRRLDAQELGDAAYLWPKAHESASALDRGHV